VPTTSRSHDLPRPCLLTGHRHRRGDPARRYQRPAQRVRADRGSGRHHVHRHPPRQATRHVGRVRVEPVGQAHVGVRTDGAHAPCRQRVRSRARAWRCGPSHRRPHAVGHRSLGPEPCQHAGVHDRSLPCRGAWLARLHAAEDPAAHQSSQGGARHGLRARLFPPATDPDRDDVRRARQPLARGSRRGRHDHHGRRLLRVPVGSHAQCVAGGDGPWCGEHRVRRRCRGGGGHVGRRPGLRRWRERDRHLGGRGSGRGSLPGPGEGVAHGHDCDERTRTRARASGV
ncbi:MAG: hypothetical protein AVDCRST_MAG60-1815, partial [uncultured Nocardioides sp.]